MTRSSNTRSWSAIVLLVLTFVFGLLLTAVPFLLEDWRRAMVAEWASYPLRVWLVSIGINLSGELGKALLIAGVLAIVVDLGAKAELVAQAVRAASKELLANNFPVKVRQAILALADSPFVRRNWKVHYFIQETESKSYLRFVSQISGELVNVTDKSRKWTFFGSVDRADDIEGLDKSQLTKARIACSAHVTDLSGGKLQKHTTIQSDGSQLFKHTVTVAAGEKIETLIESVEYRPRSYAMPLFVGTSADEVEVQVHYDQSKFEVFLSVGVEQNMKGDTNALGKVWKIKTALLAGSCILTTWSPKRIGSAS